MSRPPALQLDLFRTAPTAAGEAGAPPPAPGPGPGELHQAAPNELPEPVPTAAEKPSFSRQVVRSRLAEHMPGRLGSITLTNNRSSILSARENGGKLDLRIHRSFAAAPDETLAAVAVFLLASKRSAARRRALATIRAFFERHQAPAEPPRRRRIILRPIGRTFDLRALRDAVNRRYFDSELSVQITWGRGSGRRRRKGCGFSVRLGTYSERDNVVRIHPCLDHPSVPRYVVEAVIHHELLHAAIPAVVVDGRRRIHTPEFRRRERLFSHYDEAERWIDRNLARLIGAA